MTAAARATPLHYAVVDIKHDIATSLNSEMPNLGAAAPERAPEDKDKNNLKTCGLHVGLQKYKGSMRLS